jgi:hypothetical protein
MIFFYIFLSGIGQIIYLKFVEGTLVLTKSGVILTKHLQDTLLILLTLFIKGKTTNRNLFLAYFR